MENLQLKNIENDLESQIQKENNDEKNQNHRKTQSAIPNICYKENKLKSVIAEKPKENIQKPNDNFIDQIENIVDNSKIDNKTKCKNIVKIILKYTISTGFGIFLGQYVSFF